MLKELRIKNLAIIKEVELHLENKLIVLTGETGAGKSIIIDGINLLIGDKVSVDMIRSDSDYLEAEGVFSIPKGLESKIEEMGIELEENEIIIRRRLEKNSKGKAFINGRRIPVKSLKEIMTSVVDLVGQHSHQMLLNKKHHLGLIDKFLDDEADEIKKELLVILNEYKQIDRKIKNIEELKKDAIEKKELYDFQYQEISFMELKENEDEDLEEEYSILFNAGKIHEKLNNSLMVLKEGDINVLSSLTKAKRNMGDISKYTKEFEQIYEKLDKIYYELEDVVYSIENNSDIDTDDLRLNKIVDRIDKINLLKRKYGSNIQEILDYAKKLEENLEIINSSKFEEEQLLKEKEEVLKRYEKKSLKLSEKRRKIVKDIEYKLTEELKYLNMTGVSLKGDFKEDLKPTKEGRDIFEFMISTNIGEDLKPLSKIVSGGEVSRIMLALKSIFSKVDNIPLLIFDEIDTGVGGETVRKLAEKLKEISFNAQIICISHSPQIAAKAKQQFYIEKNIENNKTITSVRELDYNGRVKEIARMLAGEEVSEVVIKHATELLKGGQSNGL